MNNKITHVAVAAVINDNDEVLISQRHPDSHLGGLWEFPGGKLEPGETIEQALKRELHEELGIRPESFRPLIKITHHYPDKSVLLDVWKVETFSGEPTGLEGQPVVWQSVSGLDPDHFPAADRAIIQALKLPELYLISGSFKNLQEFEKRLESALETGIRLVQLRLKKDWIESVDSTVVQDVFNRAAGLCLAANAKLLLNVPETAGMTSKCDGIHLDSKKLMQTQVRPVCQLLSASCHNEQELEKAKMLNADFVVLSPVQATASHPDTEPLGWQKFSEMVSEHSVPVYALGGVSRIDLEQAWKSGAQGIAAISSLWN